jgi:hypothetical protein
LLVGYDIANPPGYPHNPLIRLGQTITMIVLARPADSVNTVLQQMDRHGNYSFGIVSSSLALDVGYIALLTGGIGVATTLWTSVNERTKVL